MSTAVPQSPRIPSSSKRAPLGLTAAVVAVALFAVLPLAYLTVRTLGVGTEVLDLLWRSRTLAILGRTALLIAIVVLATAAIAVPAAWITLRTDVPFRRMLTVASVLPLVVPSYVASYVAIGVLGPRGMLQQALEPLGIDRLPSIYGLPGAIFVLTVISYPYILLPVRAALMRADPALEEAARSLGYGTARTFFRVTLPILKPAIASGALLVALYTLSEFGAVSLLQYETFTWAIYVQYNFAFDRHAASSLALVLTALALAIVWMERRTRSRARYYRSSAGSVKPPSVVKLGRWRWPAFLYVILPVCMGLVAPVAFLSYWLVRGLAGGQSLDLLWSATSNSLMVAGLAGAAAVALAVPVAVMVVRFPGRIAALSEQSTYLGFALPGIVVALAVVFLGINFLPAVYQTETLLVAAYVLLFLSVAVGALRAVLLQVSPHLEEAAQSLGLTHWRALLRVTLPLVWPGALAGGAMVFLLTMKELPATLILRPAGFDTLATSIWSAVSEAFFTRGAAAALLLIVVAGPPTAYLVLQEHWANRKQAHPAAVDEASVS